MKNIVTENRVGYIRFTANFFTDYTTEEMRDVLGNFIIFNVESYGFNELRYLAYSQYFKMLKRGDHTREYMVILQKGAGKLRIQSVEEI